MDEYMEGFIDGMTCFAWWKDGVQYVGTTGKILKEAIEQVKETWNYTPNDQQNNNSYWDFCCYVIDYTLGSWLLALAKRLSNL